MKHFNKTLFSLSILSLTTCLNIQTAQATSLYTGIAELSINITGIHNQSNSGMGYGNDIQYFGTLGLDEYSSSTTPVSGGSVTPTLPNNSLPSKGSALVLPINYDFSQSMKIDGTVSNGNIESYYFFESILSFKNLSSNDYVIDYTVNYNLSVETTGSGTTATASITEENFGLPDDGYIEVGTSSSSLSESGTPNLSLFLAAGETVELYAALEFSGEASATSPVPLPGAVWLFLAGLLALPKFKQNK